jgi:hypothetical protein
LSGRSKVLGREQLVRKAQDRKPLKLKVPVRNTINSSAHMALVRKVHTVRNRLFARKNLG